MISKYRKVSEQEIQALFELLGMATEEQRRKILSQISLLQEPEDTMIRTKGDNITRPYADPY